MIDLFLPETPRRLSTPGPTDDYWYGAAGTMRAGIQVTPETAMGVSAVWAASNKIAGALASLPVQTLQALADGGRRQAREHRNWKILHDEPNPEMDSYIFWEMMTNWWVNYGNGIAEKEVDGAERLIHLWPIHPSRIPANNIKREGGRIVYYVRNNNGTTTPVDQSRILNIVGALSADGIIGKGVIHQAMDAIAATLANERCFAAFYGNDATPTGVLEHPATLSGPARENIRKEWNSIHQGPNNKGNIAILWEGMKYATTGVDAEKAQLIQAAQFRVTDMARWYDLPPHAIADLTRSSFSNIDSQQISLVVDSYRPRIVRVERSCRRQLFTEKEKADGYFMKFIVDAMLRGDPAVRATVNQTKLINGSFTINDWLLQEDQNPIGPIGDTRFVPANLMTLERAVAMAAAQPEQPKPDEVPPDEGDEPDDDATDIIDEPEQNAALDLFEKLAADNRADVQAQFVAMRNEAMSEEAVARRDRERAQPFRLAAAAVLSHAIRRMLHKETSAARRAAGKPREFVSWLDEFYGKHGETLTEALGPALATVRALGIDADTATIVAAHVARSRDELLAACECQADELPGKIEACVSAWDARADELASGLLGE